MPESRLSRVFIIEGIPGSGKDTLSNKLLTVLHQDTHPVYYYPEESVGWSYNHFYWPGITEVRISIMEAALDFMEEESKREHWAVFVFNRFHLSMGVFLAEYQHDSGIDARYTEILKRLRNLNSYVLLLKVDETQTGSFLHSERTKREFVWKTFLIRRFHESPYPSLHEVYMAQQQQLLWLAHEQGLPYRAGTVDQLSRFVVSL